MKVIIEAQVQQNLRQFYDASLRLHPSLDEATVTNKIIRLYEAINSLRSFPYKHPVSSFNRTWIANGYRDLVVEDIHIAYEIAEFEDGEAFVHVVDAEHSLLHHD